MLDDKGRVIEEGMLVYPFARAHAHNSDIHPPIRPPVNSIDGSLGEGQTVVVMVTVTMRPALFTLTFH